MAVTRRFHRDDEVVVITESGARTGPTYVLVHGLGMAHEYWAALADALEPTGRVLALDLPGFGDSPDPAAPLSMPESGSLLAELIEAEGLDRPVLVGHSTGAQVVAEAAAQRPDLVGPIVLIGATVNPRERTITRQSLRFLQDIAIGSPKVFAIGLHSYLEGGMGWYVRNLRPMIAHRMEDVLPRIQARTLVVRAERDRVVPRDWGREMTALAPHAAYVEVPGRGHETMVTAGPEVARLIARHATGLPVGEPVAAASVSQSAGPPPTDAATPVPLTRKARAWIADYAYAGLRQLAALGARRPPAHWLKGDDALPDIVLLPGVYEHWSFLRPLAERLNRAGYRVRTVHGLGVNRLPIVDTGDRLVRALARLPVPQAGRVIVGHSKGGLIGKHLLVHEAGQTAPGEPGPLGVLGVVAVATPFGGSRRARLLLDPAARAFLPDDETIVMLGGAGDVNGRIVSIFGGYDPHVPEGSALDGATNVLLPVDGHFTILRAPETESAVLEGLEYLAHADAPAGSAEAYAGSADA
ncbi:alpha/beta fold hydrolase [Agromyces sp. G08B096]|uniref:Alpha/beta fold hydrolase n=1 Tax=Agromyces sp. G08B096 TaxID=3156399 RepID=A0AAU7W6R9_9MICO